MLANPEAPPKPRSPATNNIINLLINIYIGEKESAFEAWRRAKRPGGQAHACGPSRREARSSARVDDAPGRALPSRVPSAEAGKGRLPRPGLRQRRGGGDHPPAPEAFRGAGCGHSLFRHPDRPVRGRTEPDVRGRRRATADPDIA